MQQTQRVAQDKPRAVSDAGNGRAGRAEVAPPSTRDRGLGKVLYKPLGMVVSVLGGVVAGAVFKKVWTALAGEDEAPQATSAEHSIKEVLVAAAIQGAIFGAVKAAVDRAGARGFEKVTGINPVT